MAGWGHLYITAHGEFLSDWAGETAQIGLRFLARPLGSGGGPIVDVPDNGDVEQIYNTFASTNFNVTQTFNLGFPGLPVDTSQFLVDMADDVLAFMNATKTNLATTFSWKSVKIAPIEKGTGKYLAPSSILSLKTPVTGSGGATLPPEVAVAISMRAGIVGKRGRGRVYFPAPASGGASTTGKVGSSARNSYSAAFKTLIQSLEQEPGADTFQGRVAIMSANSLTAVLPTEVRVGDHFDVQRRRQHQVDETYTIVAL